MGHKIHPKGFRLGTVFTWDSRWFAGAKQYPDLVIEDSLIRKFILKKLQPAGVTKIEIERSINKINLILHVVRPGMVIGRGGQGMEELKKFIKNSIIKHRKDSGLIADQKNSIKLDIRV